MNRLITAGSNMIMSRARKHSLAIAIALVCVLATARTSVAEPNYKSVYVDIRLNSCKLQAGRKNFGYVRYRCGAGAGWRVYLEGEEGTTTVTLKRNGAVRDIGITDFTNGDIAPGDKLELRLHNGSLYSTVIRLNESQGNNVVYSKLFVSKIGADQSCVVEIVEPGPDQAAKARAAADNAATLECIDE
jgi:hypothetical protein